MTMSLPVYIIALAIAIAITVSIIASACLLKQIRDILKDIQSTQAILAHKLSQATRG